MELIHRDIKPGNIRVAITDKRSSRFWYRAFGYDGAKCPNCCRFSGGQLKIYGSRAVRTKRRNEREDVFGLGCCLYEGLVGTPFYGTSSLRDISRLSNEAEHLRFLQQRMTEIPDTVPKSIQSVVFAYNTTRSEAHSSRIERRM